ncbi:MAG TPA: CYTH and CHAD domain-containing protein [Candidatus Eremiobacteraceae bacterium]|nr:CYTH and CHAD domain-containing protein [Candidatus Eremiobacteraceae bacterium]
MLEREIKLAAPASFRLEAVTGLGGGYRMSKIERVTFDSRYFDSADYRLARAGCSLRHRTGRGWTLKLPQSSEQSAMVRLEISSKAGPRTPPPALLDLVTAYVRTRRVRPVATLRTIRRTVNVRGAGGSELAEIAEDEVSLLATAGEPFEFREIEVELREQAPPALLVDLARRLQAVGAGEFISESKIQRALGGSAALVPEFSRPPVSLHSGAGTVIRAQIAAHVAELQANDAAIRLGYGPEPLHVARVAARRLRSALRTFCPVLDQPWARRLRDDLRWLGRCLGAARDADVLVQRLRENAAHLDDDYGAQRARFIAALHEGLDPKYRSVRRALRSPRYARLLDRLVSAASQPRLTARADEPARELLPRVLEKPWRKMRKAAKGAGTRSPDKELHELRICVRRCRYAIETGVDVLGPPVDKFAAKLARLQEALGEQHDSVVARDYIRRVAAKARASRVGAALLDRERRVDFRCRRAWPKAWAKVKRAKFF